MAVRECAPVVWGHGGVTVRECTLVVLGHGGVTIHECTPVVWGHGGVAVREWFGLCCYCLGIESQHVPQADLKLLPYPTQLPESHIGGIHHHALSGCSFRLI